MPNIQTLLGSAESLKQPLAITRCYLEQVRLKHSTTTVLVVTIHDCMAALKQRSIHH